MQTMIILGRQPALGLAELESLYGADKITPVGNVAALLDIPHANINFSRLGGMVKFCKVLTPLPTTNWGKIQKFLEQAVPVHAAGLAEGKLTLGLSAYDLGVSPQRLQATGLTLKKLVRASGRPVRLVPNKEPDLNAAQVLHNNLTRKNGWELVFVRHGDKTIVAQSIAVQDIERYAARDQGRPARDSKVGMLPPKLAQIIINLAVGPAVDSSSKIADSTILDPFCGTGVVLQEALLMGYNSIGTDLEPRMIDYSQKNLEWLSENYNLSPLTYNLSVADATSFTWKAIPDFIACETYLGRPFSTQPDAQTMQKVIQDCDTIHKKFLQNTARQTKPGFRMCIAVPAWAKPNSKFQIPNSKARGFLHLPTLDKLAELGYNRMSFVHASNDDLIYHREGQVVARELVVLTRK